MLVDVDEPIESYKEQIFLGMDLATSLVFAAAFVCSVGYMAVSFFVLKFPLVIGVYTCWIPGSIIVLIGKKLLIEKSSLIEKRMRKKYIREDITFYSTESTIRIEGYLTDSPMADEIEDSEEEIKKIVFLLKVGIAVIMLVFIGLVFAAVCIKKGLI